MIQIPVGKLDLAIQIPPWRDAKFIDKRTGVFRSFPVWGGETAPKVDKPKYSRAMLGVVVDSGYF